MVKTIRLSPTQTVVLAKIKATYAKAIADELQRWGQDSADNLASKGICTADLPHRTVLALARKGQITLSHTTGTSNHLRYGPYGRTWNGSVTRTYTTTYAIPTEV